MGAGIRMPLRVLLPCLAVNLVAFGAAAASVAGVSAASGDLIRQADDDLLACASSMLSRGSVAAPGSGPVSGQVPPGACAGSGILKTWKPAGAQTAACAPPWTCTT